MGASLTPYGKAAVANALMGVAQAGAYYFLINEEGGMSGTMMCVMKAEVLHGVAEVLTPYSDTDSGYLATFTAFKPIADIAETSGNPTVAIDIGLTGSGATLTIDPIVFNEPIVFSSFRLAMPRQFGSVLLSTVLQDRLMTAIMTPASTTTASMFPGSVKFYSGTAPTDADVVPTGTLLATWSTATSGFTNTEGIIRPSGIPIAITSSATGTIGYARMVSNSGNCIQFSVGISSGDMRVSSMALTAGGTFNVMAFDITSG